jgi:hypothetical protein
MRKSVKKRAPRGAYVSQNQLTLSGFESPFYEQLNASNRWVQLAKQIPWDELVSAYMKRNVQKSTGRPSLNPRVAIGAVIIKHLCNLDDRETVSQITENMYMQYFLGYSSYSPEPPFDPSLFVEIRKRMGDDLIAEMNDKICDSSKAPSSKKQKGEDDKTIEEKVNDDKNKGELIVDATACPQDIAYPTDISLLDESRMKAQAIIDRLHKLGGGGVKPRTYRNKARKAYLQVAQNRNPSKKVTRKGVRAQLQYLNRNLKIIGRQLDSFESFPLNHKWQRYYWIIQTLYIQQKEMFDKKSHSVEHRIVSIHQPHIRPIVRGKSRNKTEFGAKIHLSMVDGYSFLDTISWDAYHEGAHLQEYVENYRARFGFYPAKVLADKLYCSRENRKWLKDKNIKLAAKPLGRPSAKAVEDHVRPGERNPIEGKFGQAKNGYGMNRIRARLKSTSQSWIASIILVLNLVKLAGAALWCLGFSAWIEIEKQFLSQLKRIIGNLKFLNQPDAKLGWFHYMVFSSF